jgi:hypothetical protein
MIERIETLHPVVVRALRAKGGMERLRLAHESWELVRDRLIAYVASRHPEWPQDEVHRDVARRLLHDTGRAAQIPH